MLTLYKTLEIKFETIGNFLSFNLKRTDLGLPPSHSKIITNNSMAYLSYFPTNDKGFEVFAKKR